MIALVVVLAIAIAAQAAPAPPPAPPPPPAKVQRIAVMKTEVGGDVDAALGAQVTARLADEIRAVTQAQVISSDEMVALLKHEKDRAILGECKDDESCIAELAQALGADVVVAAKLSKVENAIGLAVSAVDAHTASVKGRVNETWGGDVVDMLALVRPVVVKLFATDSIPKGRIEIVGALAGSRIFVDGEARGTAELARIDGVLIGGHRVVVQHPERKAFEKWVVVDADRTVSIAAAQESLDEGLLGNFWFWAGAGGTVAVVTAGAIGAALLFGGGRTGVNVQVNADDSLGGAQ